MLTAAASSSLLAEQHSSAGDSAQDDRDAGRDPPRPINLQQHGGHGEETGEWPAEEERKYSVNETF